MKTLITLFLAFSVSFSTFAQQGINYKALIKDANGNALVSADLTAVQFIIYKGAALTENVYQETHTPTTDANGIIIVNIGTGTTTDVFTDIEWASDEHWLNVQIDSGDGLVDIVTTQFMAVPYALSAANVSGLEKVTENNGTIDKTGWRLVGRDPENIGSIGEHAVDLSYSQSEISPEDRGATGDFSAALNIGSATGFSSIATGFGTEASGYNSTAMGHRTIASAFFSTAIGIFTVASGQESIAMGSQTSAPSFAEIAVGRLNTIYTPNNALEWDEADRLFTVGNGTFGEFDTNLSDALIIQKNGTITAPSFDISEITDNKALITKEYLDANAVTKIGDLLDVISNFSGSSLFVGADAGLNDDGTNDGNVALGKNALKSNITGGKNTAIGYNALNTNQTGRDNTALGNFAGFHHRGNGNIFIGNFSGRSLLDVSNNKLYLNNEASDEPLIYGDFDTDLLRVNGTLDITENLQVTNNLTVAQNLNVANDINVVGTFTIAEKINTIATGNANMIPIAYGTVESNANELSGTGNFSATISSGVITITIDDENLTVFNSSCTIVPYGGNPRFSTVTYVNNKLEVRVFNSSGTITPTTFQFVIYKL